MEVCAGNRTASGGTLPRVGRAAKVHGYFAAHSVQSASSTNLGRVDGQQYGGRPAGVQREAEIAAPGWPLFAKRHIDAIAAHCAGLETLSLRQSKSMAPLDAVWGDGRSNIADFLAVVAGGSTDVMDTGRRVDWIDGIAKSCSKLDFFELLDARRARP